ncbi:helix-turn-helix transcriptional regulator [Saccharopolyspora oryzae]|uniref:Helix-turn-helix transcriptional regulator n=1 Tax=Saccharopolyspora oryzae TaxID=2997343 RepID=A0ABT4V5D5_9PSEU|nr:helix-turn-helix transcriptional regulator [Saccharopolyspora oryzae]MDA3628651.1 helix-turn-helix transcriptional regulator [Saccharopolyspora oryzae]
MANTPRARALSRLMKEAQRKSGLSVREVAEQLDWSKSRVSRVENVAQGINETDVASLLAVLGVTGHDREQLLRMVRELDEPVWWELHKDLPDQLSALIDAEQRAVRLTTVSPTVIPGLLQTRAYSRALFESDDRSPYEVEQAISLRQTRQGILDRTSPAKLIAYIDEPVLWRPVKQPKVRLDQLRHLLKLGAQPNIVVQVIPLDADFHFALNGVFTLLEFDDDEPHVFTEAPNAGSMVTGSDDVAAFRKAVARVSEVALSPAESAELIAKHAEGIGEE